MNNKIMNISLNVINYIHFSWDRQPVRPTGGLGRPVTRGQDQRLDGFRMASMDISLIPCMPRGIILPPSWGAYKCVLCNSGVIMFFRKDPPQTEGRRHADLRIKTSPVEL